MRNINFLESFPKIERHIKPGFRNENNRKIAKCFDKEFFDGDRLNGYGGYYYDGRWRKVVENIKDKYNLNSSSAVLDIGCAKGFLVYDFLTLAPGINIMGMDVSTYAINHAMDGYKNYLIKNGTPENKASELEEIARSKVLPRIIKGTGSYLPWPDNTFDAVLSINSLHNLNRDDFKIAISEINRVSKPQGNKFLQLDSWTNNIEKERMANWALTAETMMSDIEWLNFFKECNYDGDYSWTIV